MNNIMPEVQSSVKTLGMDLSKNVITVYGVNAQGDVVLRRNVGFAQCHELLAQLPVATVVAMEACGSAHYWARTAQARGLTVRMMAADFVAPFRKSKKTKNDANDAEAIVIACQQPRMRFVSVKSEAQQTRLAFHVLRQGWKAERTALINRARGLLFEFGVPIALSTTAFFKALSLAQQNEQLPLLLRQALQQVNHQLQELEQRIDECERQISDHLKHDEQAQRLQRIHGIGAITADAISASVNQAGDFKNGRQFAAWLGLVPRQYSTGGKPTLGKITRRGDAYLRGLLTQCSRSSLQSAMKKEALLRTHEQRWMVSLYERVGYHKTLIAIANKHARQVWAMMVKGEEYNPEAWRQHPLAA
jgi:transposase